MTSVRTVKPGMAAAALALTLAAAGAAHAAIFTSSVSFSAHLPEVQITNDFSLPQYSGGGAITNVNLMIQGTASGVDFYYYDPQYGITVASFPVSWDVRLYGPDGLIPPLSVDAGISTELIGGSIPGCGDDPNCGGSASASFGTQPAAFNANANVTDLSDFKGFGDNSFFILDNGFFDINNISVTVTETITTAVPEPTTWALLLFSFGAVGGVLRARRARENSRTYPAGA